MADILTDAYFDLLSEEARSRDDIRQRVELAEIKVVDRYRDDRESSLAWYWDGELDPSSEVRLVGWVQDADGTVDIGATDDELLRRLRLVIAGLVDWSLQHEEIAMLDSESVGSKSVSYSDAPTIPTRLFRPLNRFDESRSISGLW